MKPPRQFEGTRRWKCPFCPATWVKYPAWLGRRCPECDHSVLIEWEPVSPGSWVGKKVVAPSAPKHAKHGYRGPGYIGRVVSEEGDLVTVRFGGMSRTFHRSRLSVLTA